MSKQELKEKMNSVKQNRKPQKTMQIPTPPLPEPGREYAQLLEFVLK